MEKRTFEDVANEYKQRKELEKLEAQKAIDIEAQNRKASIEILTEFSKYLSKIQNQFIQLGYDTIISQNVDNLFLEVKNKGAMKFLVKLKYEYTSNPSSTIYARIKDNIESKNFTYYISPEGDIESDSHRDEIDIEQEVIKHYETLLNFIDGRYY